MFLRPAKNGIDQLITGCGKKTVYAKNLEEESKLIEGRFEYVRYSEKDDVAIYRKRK